MRDDRLSKDVDQTPIYFEFHALSNSGKTNSYKVLVFEIWLFENQSPWATGWPMRPERVKEISLYFIYCIFI